MDQIPGGPDRYERASWPHSPKELLEWFLSETGEAPMHVRYEAMREAVLNPGAV